MQIDDRCKSLLFVFEMYYLSDQIVGSALILETTLIQPTECQIEIQEKLIWGTCDLANWQKIFTFYSFQHVCISGGTLQTTLKGLTYNGVIRRSTESPWNRGFSYRVYCPTSVLLVGQPVGNMTRRLPISMGSGTKTSPQRIKQWISPIFHLYNIKFEVGAVGFSLVFCCFGITKHQPFDPPGIALFSPRHCESGKAQLEVWKPHRQHSTGNSWGVFKDV